MGPGGGERGGNLQTVSYLQPALRLHPISMHVAWVIYLSETNTLTKEILKTCRWLNCVNVMASLYSLYKHREAGLLGERTCVKAAIGEWPARHIFVSVPHYVLKLHYLKHKIYMCVV